MLFNHVYYALNHPHLKDMNFFLKIRLIFVLLASLQLYGCASWLPEPHKLDLHQGNSIKLEQLEQLEIGMSMAQVRRIMGSPILSDPFHSQRWDYIYRFIPNKGFNRKSLLTLHFDNERLVSIDDSEYIEP